MTATKDKLVTVESIAALHDYNEKRTKIGYSDTAMESYIDTKVVAGPDGSTLVPNVSIVAEDKANNSIASINVTDHSSMGGGNSSCITLNAKNIELIAEIIALSDKGDDTVGVTGNIVAFDNLTVIKTLSATSNIICNQNIDCSGYIKSGGDFSCGGNAKVNANLTVEGEAGFYGKLGVKGDVYIEDGYSIREGTPVTINGPKLLSVENNILSIGRGYYDKEIGSTNIFGNEVHILSKQGVYIQMPNGVGAKYGVNTPLWEGYRWMGYTNNNTSNIVKISLSEPVSAQPNGIVLVFSWYDYGDTSHSAPVSTRVKDKHYHSFFVPKGHISKHSGCENSFTLTVEGLVFFKILCINDTEIIGNHVNMDEDIHNHLNNRNFVLREVWGV